MLVIGEWVIPTFLLEPTTLQTLRCFELAQPFLDVGILLEAEERFFSCQMSIVASVRLNFETSLYIRQPRRTMWQSHH
jgi:hypothetical protein